MQTFEEALIDQCAPTLAGIKPANLFRFRAECTSARDAAALWDRKLEGFGIEVRILKEYPSVGASMVYVCRGNWVLQLLKNWEISAFLSNMGYQMCEDMAAMLDQLSARFGSESKFPHEMGVFLGYPLRDVMGFLEHQGRDEVCCGCWKAYGDPECAERYFACCRRCTAVCRELYRQGVPIPLFTASPEVFRSAAWEKPLCLSILY